MWKTMNIKSSREVLNNSITHPNKSTRSLFVLPDICYLIKNTHNLLLKNDIILNEEFCNI